MYQAGKILAHSGNWAAWKQFFDEEQANYVAASAWNATELALALGSAAPGGSSSDSGTSSAPTAKVAARAYKPHRTVDGALANRSGTSTTWVDTLEHPATRDPSTLCALRATHRRCALRAAHRRCTDYTLQQQGTTRRQL